MTDILSRLSRNPTRFESLSEGTRKALQRAASARKFRVVTLTPEQSAEIGSDWLMVPSKRGERQVVVSGTRCWAL